MPENLIRSPAAERDLEDQVIYFRGESPNLAHRFLDAVEQTFDFLLANHEVGERCEFTAIRSAGTRIWPVDGFRNHLVFFRPTEEGVEILRVLHGARDIAALFIK